jgi:hypothetical protein
MHDFRARFGVYSTGKHGTGTLGLTPAQAVLRKMVLDTVPSTHSKRNYEKALDG